MVGSPSHAAKSPRGGRSPEVQEKQESRSKSPGVKSPEVDVQESRVKKSGSPRVDAQESKVKKSKSKRVKESKRRNMSKRKKSKSQL
ncbi:hypothetical protein PF005_g24198 [Phytophthora fragariae]|uniref:Uncharacterized protein n=1 Tax=Phytophthora fragariae TaxID=53985 RepID=A0A6A3DM17_9STRA|nr:hypothetical protein PF003_g39275 [Phytophthora fragariae]KAE8921935.1 hypothetical protein PF009_g27794 [Phytophthora fragariae]KAE9069294.1 hypothetical protein PF010_g26719 [Phytophthora fragariae]KAE9162570.1 hypothetical protein PF004_g30444 [Phytophthora fragariae]KAE9178163.1 hypothetical protein PF005_g24198 [Phytophthora fragariae]